MADRPIFSKKQANDVINDSTRRSEAEELLKDPSKVEGLIKKIISKLENIPLVGHYFADVPILCYMVSDYVKGRYREVPFATIVGIVVALIYFLSPIDFIPDSIPVIGLIDDAAVILFAVDSAHNDINDYRQWKEL